jgi:DNA (cytosine-5)-methyltransferase 1
MAERPTVVSLFAGAGGLDLGFKQAGFDIVFASDYAQHLKETYDRNHGAELVLGDIRELDYEDIPDSDGIVGGPPCQSWSLAGSLRGAEDERGGLFYEYIEVIKAKKPKFFVAENVPGLISKANIDEFERIIDKFDDIGYDVYYEKLNAAYYNVPQERFRVIIVGFRQDLDVDFSFPDGTDEKMVQEDCEALLNLPEPKGSTGEPHNPDELEVPNHEYFIGSHSSRYMSRNRVRSWDEPAYTVMANARHQKIHPQAPKMTKVGKDDFEFKKGSEKLYRRYSVKEAALLQTFPEDFVFEYNKLNDAYKMIGNAVPVNLAQAVAESINETLAQTGSTVSEVEEDSTEQVAG